MGRHIKRFDNGRRTPQEYHAQHAFSPNARCYGCGLPPSTRAIVMMPCDEAEKHGMIPPGAGTAPFMFPELAPVIVKLNENGTARWYVRTSLVYACTQCRPTMEKALAKSPSWAVVEINRGPDPKNRVHVGAGVVG